MAGDPYWNNVVLAMHMNDTGLTDVKGHAVTLNGTAARSAANSKFGGFSAVFDGANSYLTIPASADFGFGVGDFAIECWVKTTVANTVICDVRSTSTDAGVFFIAATTGKIAYYDPAVGSLFGSTTNLANGAWHHVAWSRLSGVLKMYVDGVAEYTGAMASNFGASRPFRVGRDFSNAANYNGYIDDLRVTKGASRYTANFSVPTATFADHMVQVSGIVKDVNGALTSKPVHLHRQSDGALAGVAISDAVTGAFTIDALDTSAHYATCIYSNTEPAITHHNIIPV